MNKQKKRYVKPKITIIPTVSLESILLNQFPGLENISEICDENANMV